MFSSTAMSTVTESINNVVVPTFGVTVTMVMACSSSSSSSRNVFIPLLVFGVVPRMT